MAAYFRPLQLGAMDLSHRIVMSAMTRCRNDKVTEAPTDLVALYYRQRASRGGLLISEMCHASPLGRCYMRGGHLYTQEHIDGWHAVTRGVREAQGHMFAQLVHCGRVSHSSLLPEGVMPMAPSPIAIRGLIRTPVGKQPYETPRAITAAEIPVLIDRFVAACRNAMQAGFDGVELHAGNGYLIQQFLALPTNQRTDGYGGSVANRCRFVLELVDAVCDAITSRRVGIKLQPGVTFSDLIETEEDSQAQLAYLGPELARRDLAYVCLSSLNGPPYHAFAGLEKPNFSADIFRFFRTKYAGPLMINGAISPEAGEAYLKDGQADLVAFGVPFVATANAVDRIRHGKPLNYGGGDTKTWYSLPESSPAEDEQYYTDWPLEPAV